MDDSNPVNPIDGLAADELFQLGLQASQAGDTAAALASLRMALAKDPAHARAHWAMATEYAAMRMPAEAEQHFELAVLLDPSQPVARFQYGLLLLTMARIDAADQVWAPLDGLPATEPLRLFKAGLQHMVRDQFEPALALIREGIATPQVDPALKRDMEMIVARIEAAMQSPQSPQPGQSEPVAVDDPQLQRHLAFAAYAASGQNKPDGDDGPGGSGYKH